MREPPWRWPGVLLALFAAANAAGEDLEVILTPPDDGTADWQVHYRLAKAADAVVFARGNGDYRTTTWILRDDAFVIERFGNSDRIRRQDGKPFAEFSARFSPYSGNLPKDYTPYLKFSDGALAAFTGQFIVGVPRSDRPSDFIDGANNDNTLFPDTAMISLDPGDFEHMIVNAHIVDGPAQLALDDGEYVYFGDADAIETPTLTAVMDEAAPDWLRQLLYESMAATFDYFERRLGPLPGGKPFLLTSFSPLEGGRISFTGGVIGSQLAIELGLGKAIEDTPEHRQYMALFFAHESAHLWNNNRVVSNDGTEAWMHEGSAEALAWLALNASGWLGDADLLAEFQRAANDCAGYLADGPLQTAGRREAFRAYYDCGAVIALATQGIMRQRQQDLFDFWRVLIEQGEAGDRSYRSADYRSLLGRYSETLSGYVQTFAEAPRGDGQAAVAELLKLGGVDASRDAAGRVAIAAMP